MIGDNLLGWFDPTKSFGLSKLFPIFSREWADASPIRFVAGGACGVIALLLMFLGFYALYKIMKDKFAKLSKLYIVGVFLFCSVGILYHCVFAITAYSYNRLVAMGVEGAEAYSWNLFTTFLSISIFAAIGFCFIAVILFIVAISGKLGFPKWLAILNPCIIMFLSILLSMLLPACKAVNGFLGWGQQSIGLIIIFLVYFILYDKQTT